MKAKLIFDLDNFDDRKAHLRAAKSLDMALLLFDFTTKARKKLIEEHYTDEYISGVEAVIREVYDLMEEYNIDLNELID